MSLDMGIYPSSWTKREREAIINYIIAIQVLGSTQLDRTPLSYDVGLGYAPSGFVIYGSTGSAQGSFMRVGGATWINLDLFDLDGHWVADTGIELQRREGSIRANRSDIDNAINDIGHYLVGQEGPHG